MPQPFAVMGSTISCRRMVWKIQSMFAQSINIVTAAPVASVCSAVEPRAIRLSNGPRTDRTDIAPFAHDEITHTYQQHSLIVRLIQPSK
jgi:hypothetical protein